MPQLRNRAYLIHLTHYDPWWNERKAEEQPFDLEVGLEVIDRLAEIGFNLLIIACSDGVQYASHPELTRHYSVPMSVLASLVKRAGERGLEVVPKLNFAQSALHQHNHWLRPHNSLFDTEEYWQKAFEVVDEVIGVCRPPRFFHVGMDEDHDRSYTQYARAIRTLRDQLAARGLRPLIWNDSTCDWPAAEIHKEKSLYAEERVPTDVVQVLWDYWDVRPEAIDRLRSRGFETWIAPGHEASQAAGWRQAAKDHNATGMILTCWKPCTRSTSEILLERINTLGPIICG
ncbi:MAG: hypothetical protein ACYC7E_21135 [Armatimonadota bacterium]